MAAAVKQEFGVEPELIKSGGGAFEVELDGELLFSRKSKGRFPENSEIISLIRQNSG